MVFKYLSFALIFLLWGCNADPEKIGKVKRRRYKGTKSSSIEKILEKDRNNIFGNLSKNVRLLMMPKNLKLASRKRHNIGVIYYTGDQAVRNLKLLELGKKSEKKGCSTNWVMHLWIDKKYMRVDVQWECSEMKAGNNYYSLKGTSRKVMDSLITKTRLHPNQKLIILKVPVVHSPDSVAEIIKSFVIEVVPKDYGIERYPSFIVNTEYMAPIPKDLSKLDEEVEFIRNFLRKRLLQFSKNAKRKGGKNIVKIISPEPIKEHFASYLYAKWGVTVLCNLGTNSHMMYYLANYPKVGIVKMRIPSHYTMVVVFPNKSKVIGPSLSANLSGLSLDPPIEIVK
jgi:hypothetical protein